MGPILTKTAHWLTTGPSTDCLGALARTKLSESVSQPLRRIGGGGGGGGLWGRGVNGDRISGKWGRGEKGEGGKPTLKIRPSRSTCH